MINDAVSNERKNNNFEKQWRSMPFVIDNEVLKQTNEELRKKNDSLNKKLNDLT